VPALRVHLCDESGKFRPHVLCFLNEVNTRWLDGADPRLQQGDRITILQAVSGG
jgi:molybdopterin converting factor small subunit